MDLLFTIIWILILAQLSIPYIQRRILASRRMALILKIENERKSRVITMIHRQETISLLGIPITQFLNIEDSEQVLEAIHMTPDTMPIDIILHTPGGLVLASEQIAYALNRHRGKVTVFVPHYAMSGGTLISISADEICMNPDAVLGSLDPLLGTEQQAFYPAVSVLKALSQPNNNREDHTLILGDIAKKAIYQVSLAVNKLLLKHLSPKEAERVTEELTGGKWTHDYPLFFDQIKSLGLPVSDSMPLEVYELMKLYPQPMQVRSAVEFIPSPYKVTVPKRTQKKNENV